jgi:hypothetical protein
VAESDHKAMPLSKAPADQGGSLASQELQLTYEKVAREWALICADRAKLDAVTREAAEYTLQRLAVPKATKGRYTIEPLCDCSVVNAARTYLISFHLSERNNNKRTNRLRLHPRQPRR